MQRHAIDIASASAVVIEIIMIMVVNQHLAVAKVALIVEKPASKNAHAESHIRIRPEIRRIIARIIRIVIYRVIIQVIGREVGINIGRIILRHIKLLRLGRLNLNYSVGIGNVLLRRAFERA